MNKKQIAFSVALVAAVGFFMPDLAHAGLESSLMGIKSKLTGVILPLLSVIGIAIAGISFFTQTQNSTSLTRSLVALLVLAHKGSWISSLKQFVSEVKNGKRRLNHNPSAEGTRNEKQALWV